MWVIGRAKISNLISTRNTQVAFVTVSGESRKVVVTTYNIIAYLRLGFISPQSSSWSSKQLKLILTRFENHCRNSLLRFWRTKPLNHKNNGFFISAAPTRFSLAKDPELSAAPSALLAKIFDKQLPTFCKVLPRIADFEQIDDRPLILVTCSVC